MLNYKDQLQNQQQVLFGNSAVPSQLQGQNARLNTATPFQTSIKTTPNQAQVADVQPRPQMNSSNFSGVKLNTSSQFGNQYQVNKFHNLKNDICQPDMSNKIQMSSQYSKNMLATNFVHPNYSGYEGAQATFIAKNTQNQKTRAKLQSLQMSASNFEVSGQEDIPIIENFQDQSIGDKISRSTPISMTTTLGPNFTDPIYSRQGQFSIKQTGQSLYMSHNRYISLMKEAPYPLRAVEPKAVAYPIDQLEPILTDKSVYHSYKKHIRFYNNILEILGKVDMILVPQDQMKIEDLTQSYKVNFCSLVNYELFLESIAPVSKEGGVAPSLESELGMAIEKSFGSFDSFVYQFSNESNRIGGKPLVHLVKNTQSGDLEIHSTDHQDLITDKSYVFVPILTIDTRANVNGFDSKQFLELEKNVWKIVNWSKVEERFNQATQTLNKTSLQSIQLFFINLIQSKQIKDDKLDAKTDEEVNDEDAE